MDPSGSSRQEAGKCRPFLFQGARQFEMVNNEQEDPNFSWHAEIGEREMRGTAANAAERDSRRTGAIDLMNRDPGAGTRKAK